MVLLPFLSMYFIESSHGIRNISSPYPHLNSIRYVHIVNIHMHIRIHTVHYTWYVPFIEMVEGVLLSGQHPRAAASPPTSHIGHTARREALIGH